MRKGKAVYAFPGGNTPRGFVSFYRAGLQQTDSVFILKGGPGCGKSTLIRQLGMDLLDRGYDVEFWRCSADNDSFDGVLIPALSVAVVDGTAPHVLEPLYPGAVEELVDLGRHWNCAALRQQRQEIIDLSGQISKQFASCYAFLGEAGEKYAAAEQLASQTTDAEAVKDTVLRLCGEIFCSAAQCSRHLFASAVTPQGEVSFAEQLSRRFARRYLLMGPAGGGREDILRQLAAAAEQRGHYAEIYHQPLQPDDIELICLPHLGVAVWAVSSAPGALRDSDVIVDCGVADEDVLLLHLTVDRLTTLAVECLNGAKSLHDQLELCYRSAIDFSAVDEVGVQLRDRILAIAAEKNVST